MMISFPVKKLYLFVLRSYLGPMVLTFFIALFILLMQFLWKYVDDMVGKGFEWYVIAELLFYASATFVPMALPLAILLASLMTFGNLGEHYELVAMKASGISFRKAMLPLIIFTIMLSGVAFYFSNNVLPFANLKFGTLLFDVREKKPALNINEGIFYNEIENYVIRIGKKEKDGKTIRNVMIFDHTESMGNNNVTVAEWGTMENTPDKKFLIFRLYNGFNYYEPSNKREHNYSRPLQRTRFEEEMRRFDLSEFNMIRSKEELFKDNYQMQNLHQLELSTDTLRMELNQRVDQISDMLIKNYYWYQLTDSNLYKPVQPMTAVPDSFVTMFTPREQRKIIDVALSGARGVSQQLEYLEKEIRAKNEMIYRHEIEWHRKFTLSIACLILFFVGAPLGAIIRKGGLGLPVVFSTLFFIIFHVISITGEKFVREGIIPPWEGMWISSLVFLPIGIILTYSASTDARILSTDWWSMSFRRSFGKIKGRRKWKPVSVAADAMSGSNSHSDLNNSVKTASREHPSDL